MDDPLLVHLLAQAHDIIDQPTCDKPVFSIAEMKQIIRDGIASGKKRYPHVYLDEADERRCPCNVDTDTPERRFYKLIQMVGSRIFDLERQIMHNKRELEVYGIAYNQLLAD